VIVEKEKFGVQLGALCVLWDDLGMEARRGMKSSRLYKVVNGGGTNSHKMN
jgi:hypothetical protein